MVYETHAQTGLYQDILNFQKFGGTVYVSKQMREGYLIMFHKIKIKHNLNINLYMSDS